jgi:hypothetical protein
VAALVEDWRRRAAGPVEDRDPRDIEGARSRSHGPAAERPALGLGEPESAHRWTWTTCRAAPLACSDWTSDGHGWIGSKAVEITGSRVGRAVIQD